MLKPHFHLDERTEFLMPPIAKQLLSVILVVSDKGIPCGPDLHRLHPICL